MLKKSILIIILIGLFAVSAIAVGPPKDVKLASKALANVLDNGWTILEFSAQPPGKYYLEMSDLTGTNIGCWGAKTDKYADGSAYQDGEPLSGDFKMQYTPKGGAAVDLINIPAQGAAGDDWWPFGLQEAKQSIGQTFIAPAEFVSAGFSTPTWSTANSGCTLTLYAPASSSSVTDNGKITSTWGKLKTE
jgi:hypothetical protein